MGRSFVAAAPAAEPPCRAVSSSEAAFLQSKSPTSQDLINATWRAEALLPLLWAIRRIQTLPMPDSLCDLPLVRSALPPFLGSTGDFVSRSTLRAEAEIMDAHEQTYHAHWAVRDALINGGRTLDLAKPEILEERHRALKWLIFPDVKWDDVSTDT